MNGAAPTGATGKKRKHAAGGDRKGEHRGQKPGGGGASWRDAPVSDRPGEPAGGRAAHTNVIVIDDDDDDEVGGTQARRAATTMRDIRASAGARVVRPLAAPRGTPMPVPHGTAAAPTALAELVAPSAALHDKWHRALEERFEHLLSRARGDVEGSDGAPIGALGGWFVKSHGREAWDLILPRLVMRTTHRHREALVVGLRDRPQGPLAHQAAAPDDSAAWGTLRIEPPAPPARSSMPLAYRKRQRDRDDGHGRAERDYDRDRARPRPFVDRDDRRHDRRDDRTRSGGLPPLPPRATAPPRDQQPRHVTVRSSAARIVDVQIVWD